jgi:hypothetical protein
MNAEHEREARPFASPNPSRLTVDEVNAFAGTSRASYLYRFAQSNRVGVFEGQTAGRHPGTDRRSRTASRVASLQQSTRRVLHVTG